LCITQAAIEAATSLDGRQRQKLAAKSRKKKSTKGQDIDLRSRVQQPSTSDLRSRLLQLAAGNVDLRTRLQQPVTNDRRNKGGKRTRRQRSPKDEESVRRKEPRMSISPVSSVMRALAARDRHAFGGQKETSRDQFSNTLPEPNLSLFT